MKLKLMITERPIADDMRRTRARPRCSRCGRWARYDAYLDQWRCDLDEREVQT